MSTIQTLRAFVSQRLTVAVEEIIGMFERTITEYEQEIDRHRRLLGAEQLSGFIRINTGTGECLDTQPLTVSAKTNPEKQELSPGLNQETPQPPCIKQEPEEVWTGQEGQFEGQLERVDVSNSHLLAVSMKSEDDVQSSQSSHLHQTQTEETTEAEPSVGRAAPQIKFRTEEDCGESEPIFDLDVAGFLNATSKGQMFLSQCFTTETEVLDDNWNQMMESDDHRSQNQTKLYKCPACGKTFKHNMDLQRHITCHTGERPFDCPECGKTFRQKGGLHIHMRKHTGEKPFSCLVCGKRFTQSGTLSTHMRIHTGEKPFSCLLCKKRYNERGTLVRHMRVHTGEKPFSCSLCGKRFSEKGNLNKHKRIHTGEKPFSCSVCEKKFNLLSYLKNHKCPVQKGSKAAEQAYER